METNEQNSKFLPVAVIVAGLLIAGAVLWNGSRPANAPGVGTETAPKVNIKDVKTDGNPFIGRASAPVTIALWGDFQCSYCKKFELDTLPEIIKNYVDTGKVKVVFMDFAFLGDNSVTAALYSRSVWKLYPNEYFAWRTALYSAPRQEGDKSFGNAAFIDKINATILGIDASKVAADVKINTSVYKTAIDTDKAEGQKVGVNSTPSFIIGTQLIVGAYPYANFQAAIDAALKK